MALVGLIVVADILDPGGLGDADPVVLSALLIAAAGMLSVDLGVLKK